jgi:hypothetical protein
MMIFCALVAIDILVGQVTALTPSGNTTTTPVPQCANGNIPCMWNAMITHVDCTDNPTHNYFWCKDNACSGASTCIQKCSDVELHSAYYEGGPSQCIRVNETSVLDMSKIDECSGYQCPPCMLLEGRTAITVHNCNSSNMDYFFANINNDGDTVVVVSDGFKEEEYEEVGVSRVLLAGESVYCQCNGKNRLICPSYSSCTYSLAQPQTCTTFMPGCRVTYADQSGPTVNHQAWALQYLAPHPMDPNSNITGGHVHRL